MANNNQWAGSRFFTAMPAHWCISESHGGLLVEFPDDLGGDIVQGVIAIEIE
jgi:hypothetical protein